MSLEITGVRDPTHPEPQVQGWRRVLRDSENILISVALVAMVLLPIVEIVLRKLLHVGISGSTSLVQHLTLAVGMLGGAIAARDGRLLSLSTLTDKFKGRWKIFAQVFAGSVAVAITIFLLGASVQFVQSERLAGEILVYRVPLWTVQLLLPVGFAVVALRIIRRSSDAWAARIAIGIGAGLLVWLGMHPPVAAHHLLIPALALLLVATVLGAPVFTTLGGAGLILFWAAGMPVAAIPVSHYGLVVNPALPTIPLFTIAGYVLAEGGASRRLVNVFQASVGHLRGGPAIATVLVCAFFTSFTGASGVTILALGGLLMPVLLSAKYSEKNALGLLTGAGSLGMLFPPCLPVILYSIIAGTVVANLHVADVDVGNVSMQRMFLGGLLPGILLVVLTAWWGVRQAPKEESARPKFNWRATRAAFWEAKWELLLPVVALVALFGGFATPVEAAAATALYAFCIECFVYRDLKIFKDAPRVMAECGLLVGGVLLILGVAMGLTNYLVMEEVPTHLVQWVAGHVHAQWVFLLALNIFLLLVGCMMDIFSSIVVVVPLIVPLGIAFGVDPVHLGIIFLANMELGYLHPPVGMNLFLSSYRFRKPIWEVTVATIPMMIVLWIGVLLITYIPPLTTALPRLFSR